MPRETIDIPRFTSGIISAVDQTDLPPDSAVWASDMDPDRYPGELVNRQQDHNPDTDMSSSLGSNLVNGAKFIMRGSATNFGKRDLAFYKDTGSAGSITVIKDLPAATTETSGVTGLGTGKTVSMQPHNDCVYVGWGDDANSPSKWVGYVPYGQFDPTAAAPDTLVGVNAECLKPETMPTFYKTVTDGTSIYGIEWQGKRVYKYSEAGAQTGITTHIFQSLQGLAVYDSSTLIVLDNDSVPGTLYKITMSTMALSTIGIIQATPNQLPFYNIATRDYDVSMTPSDLAVTAANVWISWYTEDPISTSLFSVHQEDSGTNILITSITRAGAGGVDAGGNLTLIKTYGIDLEAKGSYTQGCFYYGTSHQADVLKPCKVSFVTVPDAAGSDSDCIGYVIYVPGDVWNKTGAHAVMHAMYCVWKDGFTDTRCVRLNGIYGLSKNYAAESSKSGYFWSAPWSYSTTTDITSAWGISDGNNPLRCTTRLEGIYLISPVTNYWVVPHSSAIQARSSDAGTATFTFIGDVDDWTWDITYGPPQIMWALQNLATDKMVPDPKSNIDNMGTAAVSRIGDNYGSTGSVILSFWSSDSTGVSSYMPRVVGHQYFGFSKGSNYGPTDVISRIARSPCQILVAATSVVKGSWNVDKEYFYKISFRYDGLQESPLIDARFPPHLHVAADFAISITINLFGSWITSTLSKRANALVIYRAEGPLNGETPESFYREVGEIDMTTYWSSVTGAWGAEKQGVFIDTGNYGAAFESNAGFPEQLTDSNVNYELSASYGGYHFVGRCYSSLWEDASHVIFRSGNNAFSTFNVLSDYVVLPTVPVALAAWNGYLYAFDSDTIYQINIGTMGVENVIHGYGVLGKDSVCVMDDGIWIADKNCIYLFNGNISRVGDAIATLTPNAASVGTSHRALAPTYTVSIHPFLAKSMVAVLYTKSAANPAMFLYHLKTKSWHYWTIDATVNSKDANRQCTMTGSRGAFADIDGKLYVAAVSSSGTDSCLAMICDPDSSVFKAASWYTPEFPLDDTGQLKRYYGSYATHGTGSATLTYSVDGASYTTITHGAFFRRLSVKIATSTTLIRLKTLSLIFRRMIGKR